MTPTLVDLLEATSRLTYEEWSSLVVKITQKLRGVTPSGRDCEHDAARVMASLYQVAKDQQKRQSNECDELLREVLAAITFDLDPMTTQADAVKRLGDLGRKITAILDSRGALHG